MTDHIKRIFNEAQARLHDADILGHPSSNTMSDSQAIIRILAFELLLKCALLLSGKKPKRNHNYKKHWLELPDDVRSEVLVVAIDRMLGHTDLSDIEKLLNWYQFIFEKARYHYELYENYSLKEQRELGEYWIAIGSPTEEAVVQYYPNELDCLITGLTTYIEKSL